jgi:RNA polymerase sigma factor (sigma-70 family)
MPVQPETMLVVLRSARAATVETQLALVLEQLRTGWMAFAHRRYPQFQDYLDDAAQIALSKIVLSDKLEALRRVERINAWARSLFVRALFDVVREANRHSRWRSYVVASEHDDHELALRELPDGKPSAEELVSYRERLAIVAQVVSSLEVVRLKFVEDLPEKEIARRADRTRHSVAGQLKRVRQALRQAMR